MTRIPHFRSLLLFVFILLGCDTFFARAIEFGHVRARSRGWDPNELMTHAAGEDVEAEVEDDLPARPVASPRSDFAPPQAASVANSAPLIGTRTRSTKIPGTGLVLIGGFRRTATLRDGYLAVGMPRPLRFSDLDPVNDRPPSPALPEFNMVSSEYIPYLIESALPEDALNDNSMLSEIVIELEPHEVVSGRINTRRTSQEELVEHFDLDEQRTTVLRPEEVLRYFETDSNSGRSGTLVPFSPATPTTTTIKSTATLKKE